MKKVFIIIFCFINFFSFASTINVKQDGTGDYDSIQAAIDVAINGDTILIWPGTYYENINLNGKSLTIGSLMLINQDDTYKFNTIIDGGQNESCIMIRSQEVDVLIVGLTITNGLGQTVLTGGGGIDIFKGAGVTVKNCIIRDNKSLWAGAGILCYLDGEGYFKLSGCSIFNNHAYYPGGGICLADNSTMEFDTINKNSIYSNFASLGCDFHKASEDIPLKIVLDSSTVKYPDTYFFSSIQQSGFQINDLDIQIDNAVLTPYDGDIYVDPVNGNNNNSGISEDQSVKSIAWAYAKIAVDSSNKNTIHLANGIYSDTTNDEKFPLNIRPFINVIGQSRDGVILDGNRNVYILKGNNEISDYSFQRMTLQGGPKPKYESWEIQNTLAYLYYFNNRYLFDSVIFQNSYSKGSSSILTSSRADSAILRNCEFRNNYGGNDFLAWSLEGQRLFVSNTVFSNLKIDTANPYQFSNAFAPRNKGVQIIQNCLFKDNSDVSILKSSRDGHLYCINSTFVNNALDLDYATVRIFDGNISFYNSIFYNNRYQPQLEIGVGEWQQMVHSHLDIYNSLVENGEESIYVNPSCWHDDTVWCHVYYDSTNIDADPQFLGMWNHPYQLTDNSPCIDAGTLANLPDFIELEEYDLAGNSRVYGDSVDMGAYEWDPTIVGFHEIGPGANGDASQTMIKASPNPFYQDTYIEIEPKQLNTEARVQVYDNYGKLVKTLITTQLNNKVKILWRGDNNSGNPLPSGVYHVVMFYGDKEVENLKVVKR